MAVHYRKGRRCSYTTQEREDCHGAGALLRKGSEIIERSKAGKTTQLSGFSGNYSMLYLDRLLTSHFLMLFSETNLKRKKGHAGILHELQKKG